MAGSGLMAMVVTPVLSHMVADYGWRSGYRFIGSLYLLLMVPVILFVIKESPEDGKSGRGGTGDTETGEQNVKTGLTRAQAMGTRRFWLVLAALVLASSVAMGIQQHMIAYLTDMGYGQQYASGIYSLSMGVLMAGKVILGTLYDRLGIKGASVYICLALAASLGFLLMADLPGIPYLFAAAFGLANAIQSIPATCLVTRFFWYTRIYVHIRDMQCRKYGRNCVGHIHVCMDIRCFRFLCHGLVFLSAAERSYFHTLYKR